MQEDIENRSVALIISTSKLSGRVLQAAITQYLTSKKDRMALKGRNNHVTPHGKQTVKELIGQGQGVSNIEITDKDTKKFERIARKYGVDYAIKKDRKASPPKYLVFFKSRDADALTAAFTEYTGKKLKAQNRPSVLTKLKTFKDTIQNIVKERAMKKELDR